MNKHSTKGIFIQGIRRKKIQVQNLAYNLYLADCEAKYRPWAKCYDRVYHCSDIIGGQFCPECGRIHDFISYGCKHMLCPICALKKARATASQAIRALDLIANKYKADFYLLTLTQRNIPGNQLRDMISRMQDAWAILRGLRACRRDLIGWARTIEITSGDNGYHPHMHLIIIIAKNSDLSRESFWRAQWRDALALEYTPICDIRPLESIDACYEVSKYITKINKLFDQNNNNIFEDIRYICEACYNRRLRSYGGAWAAARRELKMIDADDMDDSMLQDAAEKLEDDICCGKKMISGILIWSGMAKKYKKYDGG